MELSSLLQSLWYNYCIINRTLFTNNRLWIKSFIPSGDGPRVYHIHLRRLRVLKKIGEGGFSYIYLVRCSEPQGSREQNDASGDEDDEHDAGAEEKGLQAVYALKRINVLLDEQEVAFNRELDYHRKLSGKPNIIRLIDGELVTHGSERFGLLLLPYYRRGSAQELFCQHYIDTKIMIRRDLLVKLVKDICNGLLSLHSFQPPLAFRDLKPANVLLNNKGEAVLTDFGSVDQARLQIRNRRDALALEERSMEQCTNLYRPPELFQVSSDCDIDERTDVWSLGCTIYAVMYGYSPFDGSATSAMSGKLNFPANKDKQQWEQIHSLLMKMLKIPPKERPFVPEILTEIGVQSPIK